MREAKILVCYDGGGGRGIIILNGTGGWYGFCKSLFFPAPPTEDIFSTFAKCEKNVWRGADVLHGGCSGADLAPQHVVEDLSRVLLALEVDPMEVAQQHEQHARDIHLLNY